MELQAELYHCIIEDDVYAVVDPKSYELVGCQSTKLNEFLSTHKNTTMKSLIESQVFKKVMANKFPTGREHESEFRQESSPSRESSGSNLNSSIERPIADKMKTAIQPAVVVPLKKRFSNASYSGQETLPLVKNPVCVEELQPKHCREIGADTEPEMPDRQVRDMSESRDIDSRYCTRRRSSSSTVIEKTDDFSSLINALDQVSKEFQELNDNVTDVHQERLLGEDSLHRQSCVQGPCKRKRTQVSLPLSKIKNYKKKVTAKSLFCKKMLTKVRKESPYLIGIEAKKVVQMRWLQLEPQEKQHYQQEALRLRGEHFEETKHRRDYVKSKNSGRPKGRRKGYSLFNSMMSKKIRKDMPRLSRQDTVKKIGLMWTRLSEDEKQKYSDQARTIKKDSKCRVGSRSHDFDIEDDVVDDDTSIDDNDYNEQKNSQESPKAEDVKTQPFKRLSGYTLFFKEIRSKIKSDRPGLTRKDGMTLVGRLWKQLSDEEKNQYRAKADKIKQRQEVFGRFVDDYTDDSEFEPNIRVATRSPCVTRSQTDLSILNTPTADRQTPQAKGLSNLVVFPFEQNFGNATSLPDNIHNRSGLVAGPLCEQPLEVENSNAVGEQVPGLRLKIYVSDNEDGIHSQDNQQVSHCETETREMKHIPDFFLSQTAERMTPLFDTHQDPLTWDCEKVIDFIRSLGWSKYENFFVSEEINGVSLLELTRKDFLDYGFKLGPSIGISKEIAKLRIKWGICNN